MASDSPRNRRAARPDPDGPAESPDTRPPWSRPPVIAPDAAPVLGAPSAWPALSSTPPLPDHDTASPNPSPRAAGPARQRAALNGQVSDSPQVALEKPEEARMSPRESRGGAGGQSHHRGYAGNHRRGGNGGNWGAHHGGRRDGDRRNHDWGPHQGFGRRDAQVPQQRPVQMQRPPFVQGPVAGPPPFIGQMPMTAFGPPVGYTDMGPMYYIQMMAPPPPPPPEAFRTSPYGPESPTMYAPDLNAQVRAKLLEQIEYYFSPENLCKDVFLRNKMDNEGWVSVHLIASFNRVKEITSSIQFTFDAARNSALVEFILDTISSSSELEVQGDKIRKKDNWGNWLIHVPHSATGPDSRVGSLTFNFETMALGEGDASPNISTSRTQVASNRSPSGSLSNQFSPGKTSGDGSSSTVSV